MHTRPSHRFTTLLLSLFAIVLAAPAHAVPPNKVLFDATKAEMAGSADWVIDADTRNIGTGTGGAMVVGGGSDSNPQRVPTPAASGITAGTAETYWSGANSAFAVELVKRGFSVETLPVGGRITYGDGTNAQDLSNYGIYVINEPNLLFTPAEKTAIINFVKAGGGLFIVGDHTGSDRNNEGNDSPEVLNDLMTNNGVSSNVFGFTFNLVSVSPTSTFMTTNAADPVIHGPAGNVGTMIYHAGTTMTVTTATGLIFQTASRSTAQVMGASATYFAGKIVAAGDSSCFDDGTGDPGDSLFNGWSGEANGDHGKFAINACLWLNPTNSTVCPTISTPPSPLTRCTGTSASFTVAANGTAPFTYQWRKNTVAITSATNATANSATLTISSVTNADVGSYDCIVTNSCGNATSSAANLAVNSPIALVTPPSAITACEGTTTGFAVLASGTPTITYQWRRNSVAIPAGTNPSAITRTLSIANVSAANAGSYDCILTNGCGSLTTTPVTLTVNAAPSITLSPDPVATCEGQPATFTAAAIGTPTPTLQWRRNTTPISGATSATLSIPAVSAADVGSYDCVATNSCGSATTTAATLSLRACVYGPCAADYDGSGGTPDAGDIDAFFSDWLLGTECADVDCSGGTPDASDVDQFFTLWLAGGC